MKFMGVRIMRNRIFLSARAIVVLIFISACSTSQGTVGITATPQTTTSANYRTLTVDAFADILTTQKDKYTIVNVHIPYEGEIQGTDAKVPYNDVNALMAALPDKNAPIILYCRSGRMSEIASNALRDRGYTQVWDLSGGMIAWQASGRTLIDK